MSNPIFKRRTHPPNPTSSSFKFKNKKSAAEANHKQSRPSPAKPIEDDLCPMDFLTVELKEEGVEDPYAHALFVSSLIRISVKLA